MQGSARIVRYWPNEPNMKGVTHFMSIRNPLAQKLGAMPGDLIETKQSGKIVVRDLGPKF